MEGAPGDRRLQVVDERGDLDVLAAEVTLHERLVLGLLDDALDQLAARLLGAVGRLAGGRLGQQPVQPGERLAVPDRQVERCDPAAEGLLAGRDGGLQVAAGVVAPGHHDGARHADRGALLPLRDGGRVDRALAALLEDLGAGDDEQRGVGGAQSGAQLTDEVAVAGGVDQVDLGAVVQERGDGQRDRALLADRGRVVVAHRAAVDDGAGAGDGGGVREQGLDQGRLPRPEGPTRTTLRTLDGSLAANTGERPFARGPASALTAIERPPPRHCVDAREPRGVVHTRSHVFTSPRQKDRSTRERTVSARE